MSCDLNHGHPDTLIATSASCSKLRYCLSSRRVAVVEYNKENEGRIWVGRLLKVKAVEQFMVKRKVNVFRSLVRNLFCLLDSSTAH